MTKLQTPKVTRVDKLGVNINDETPYLSYAARLATLQDTQLIGSVAEERYERLTRMAKGLLNAPIALISLVSDEEHFIKSASATPAGEPWTSASFVALECSICRHVVAAQGVVCVDDISANRVLKKNTFVTNLGVAAYLGIPLFAPDGHALGSLCVMDTELRSWQDEDVTNLADLAALVMQEMFLGRSASYAGPVDGSETDTYAQADSLIPNFSELEPTQHLQFKLALEAADMGTWVWDIPTGELEFGKTTRTLWGLPEGESVTFDAAMAQVHPEDKAGLEQALEDAFNEKAPYNYTFRVTPPDGSERWLAGRGKVIRDEEGKVLKMLGVNYDISSQKEAEQALQDLNETLEARILSRTAALEASNQDLAQFAYIASHDLQEPLRMVASYVQLLEKRYRDKLDQDGLEFIAFAADGAKRMQQLIQDLLAFSRVQTHAQPFSLVSSQNALERALKNLHLQLKETQADVAFTNLPDLNADATQLTQLFQNLIGNAIKFCEESPKIRVSAEESSSSWRISIEDNGIGIAQEDVAKIFEPFSRLHTREDFAGNGIGLAICRRIAERHGGDLWVHSTPLVGSVFYIELPKSR